MMIIKKLMTSRQHIIIITIISIITIIIIVFQITRGEYDSYLRLKDLHLQRDYLCCGFICISSGDLQLSWKKKMLAVSSFDLMEKEEWEERETQWQLQAALQFAEKIVCFFDARRRHVCCLSIHLRYL